MKKKLFLFAVLLLSAGFLFAQDTLFNSSFENWTSYAAGAYMQPSGGPDSIWTTSNKIVLLGGLPVTTIQTTDAYSGTYATEIITKSYLGITLSGTLATGYFYTSGMSGGIKMGKPFTSRPVKFSGYYKYVSNHGDSCAIYATLTKWMGSSRETVGRAKLTNPTDSVTSYTQFNLNFDYYSTDIPDSITVVFASSAAGATYVGHVGSTLYIDDISLSYSNGINQLLMPSLKVQCFPIPANTTLNFVIERNLVNGSIKIFSETGSIVKTVSITNKEFSVPVNDLSKGKYYYQIIEKNNILNTGNFLVN